MAFWDYSPAGEKIALTDSVVGNWQWRYTSGLMTSQVDARRVEVRLTDDQLGRVLRKEYQNGETPVTTIYDLGANGIGHPYSFTKGGFSTIYPERDELGRELAVKQKIPGAPQYEYLTSMEYNAAGALLRLVYPDEYWVQYNLYPGTGLLNAVVDPQGVVAEFGDYTPAGKIEYVLLRNGVSHEYLHHPMTTQLSEIQVVDPEGKILWNRQLGYSAAGDVVRSTLEADGLKSAEVYTLLAHRLQLPGAAVAYQGGRPQRVTVDGQSYGLTTDANGNILESPVFGEKVKRRKVTFNGDNKPIRIEVSDPDSPPNTATVNLEYDAAGKLAVLRSNARETFFISPHFEIQNGVATRFLFVGKLRIAMVQGNEMKFMHQDHLGSVVLMTNGYGRPVERQAFQPFGQAGRDAAARFQDKEWEKTTQLYLHGARLYDPVLRIFISADSIVQDPFDPAAYERYLFARGNPLVFTDPSGHAFLVDDILIGAAIGALIGGSFSAITGGDILQGAIVGGISGAFFGAAGGLIAAAEVSAAVPMAHQVGVHVAAGMFSGAIGAGAFGGNPGMGMLIGGLGAGAGKFASLSVPSAWGMPGKLAAASLSGGLMGGSVSAIGGGSFGHGFALGAAQATYGYFCNQLAHQWKDDYGNIIYGVNEGASSGSQKVADASSQAA
ncbi:MAG: RHS repeat-associated core domain-containing protein, partial [Desulfobacteraceae bacterium]